MERRRGLVRNLKARARTGGALLRALLTGRPRPVVVVWKITDRCNQSCLHCDQQHYLRRVGEMDTAEAIDLVAQMERAGTRVVSITGGEPLLREDIGTIVREIQRRGMLCKVNSNGWFLETHLEDLKDIDLLQLSLDGPGEEQDALRGKGSFHAVARAANLARKAGIPYRFVGVVTRMNAERLEEVLDCAHALGGRIDFQPMVVPSPCPPGLGSFLPDPLKVQRAFERLIEMKRQGGTRGRTIASTPSELAYRLRLARTGRAPVDCKRVMAVVRPDGLLTFCDGAENRGGSASGNGGSSGPSASRSDPSCAMDAPAPGRCGWSGCAGSISP